MLQPNPQGTLRQQVHEVMRFFHYSERTEETYWQWIERFLRFHRRPAAAAPSPQPAHPVGAREKAVRRHPRAMGAEEVRAFLTHLATDLQVAAAAQKQALNALVFFYGEVLSREVVRRELA